MYFQSAHFALIFLPIVAIGFFVLERFAPRIPQLLWLIAASFVFYASWNPIFLALLLCSVAANYAGGLAVARRAGQPRKVLGGLLIAADLALLAYFKYAGFLVANAHALFGIAGAIPDIALPLGISFFTFQQISYIADVTSGGEPVESPVAYTLFVTFFPHLIAGPILHHGGMIPQFLRRRDPAQRQPDLAIGLALFGIGVFKKLVFADGVEPYASRIFDLPMTAPPPGTADAWAAALSYTLQIYFDFSAYSDMAIGLARLFGVRLPVNFNSPYKSVSIVDFWRRWHMTLSRFLRDYLYIALGGNRRGTARRYANLLTTMLLGGLWHGASWTFVAWGGWHGALLCCNHALDRFWPTRHPVKRVLGWAVTMLAVIIGWVLFRAHSFAVVRRMFAAMFTLSGTLPAVYPMPDTLWSGVLSALGIGHAPVIWLGILFAIAWLAPNSQEILARYRPVLSSPDKPSDEPPARTGLLVSQSFGAGMARGMLFAGALAVYGWIVLGLGIGNTPFVYAFF